MIELHCTRDPDTGNWLVWYPYAHGGMSLLESFETEAEARAFYQEQLQSAESLNENEE